MHAGCYCSVQTQQKELYYGIITGVDRSLKPLESAL